MKNHFIIPAAVLILFAFLFPLHSFGQSREFRHKVDKSTLLYLFQNQIFGSLNTKLEEFQTAYEQDYEEEKNVFDAFDVFRKADPVYEPMLNKWVMQSSSSYAPYVARAEYYCSCAWKARGHKWARETDQKQFKEMERFFSLALLDIAEALKINAKIDICYEMMVEMGMTVGDDDLKEKALAEALKVHPYGFYVRYHYLYGLTPRWGGSYLKMDKFVDECAKYSSFNPRLKQLAAVVPADKGSVFHLEGSNEEAVKMYSTALKYWDCASYYADRGDAYEESSDYRRALADYESALRLEPNEPSYLRRKASVLYNLNRISEAQETNEIAERLDPNDEWIQKQKNFLKSDGAEAFDHAKKGYELMQSGQYETAIPELSEAIRLHRDNYVSYYNRGLCYLKLQNDEGALQDFLSVIERKRDDVGSYLAISMIYSRRGKYDDALDAINTALKLDPNNAGAFCNRALIYQRKGWNSEALRDAKKACDMGYQPGCVMYDHLNQ